MIWNRKPISFVSHNYLRFIFACITDGKQTLVINDVGLAGAAGAGLARREPGLSHAISADTQAVHTGLPVESAQ